MDFWVNMYMYVEFIIWTLSLVLMSSDAAWQMAMQYCIL